MNEKQTQCNFDTCGDDDKPSNILVLWKSCLQLAVTLEGLVLYGLTKTTKCISKTCYSSSTSNLLHM